jgi:hypothetical protein
VPQLDLSRLEALGFFRYARAEELDRIRRAVKAAPSFSFPQATRRAYHADAEELAEHGVLDFLGEVAPLLRREGVPIDVAYREVKFPASKGRPAGRGAARLNADGWLDEDGPSPYARTVRVSFAPSAEPCELTVDDGDDGGTYILFAGDREIVIYRSDGDPDDDAEDDWARATRATLAILNELLSAHGSVERAYAMYGGNDLVIVFATPEMARVINAAMDEPRRRLHDGVGNEAR